MRNLLNAEYLITFRADASPSPLGGTDRICSRRTNTKRCSIKIIRSGSLLSDDLRNCTHRLDSQTGFRCLFAHIFPKGIPFSNQGAVFYLT